MINAFTKPGKFRPSKIRRPSSPDNMINAFTKHGKFRPSNIDQASIDQARSTHQAHMKQKLIKRQTKTAKVRAPCNHNCMAVASDHVMVARICFQKKSSSEQSSS